MLGTVRVYVAGERVALPLQLRRMVAILVVSRETALATDALADALWAGRLPDRAQATLFAHIAKLRRLLGAERDALRTEPPGYRLDVRPDNLDATRFEALLASGRERLRAGDHAGAVFDLRAGLDEWRGVAFGEFADDHFVYADAARLVHMRTNAVAALTDALRKLGRHDEAGEVQYQQFRASPAD